MLDMGYVPAFRRIEYQADHIHGFQILGIKKSSCKENLPQILATVAPTGFIPPPPKEGM